MEPKIRVIPWVQVLSRRVSFDFIPNLSFFLKVTIELTQEAFKWFPPLKNQLDKNNLAVTVPASAL